MKKALRWLGRTWPLLVWVVPIVAAAKPLVPCGYDPGNASYLIATGCNLCNFGQLIQNVINFLVLISLPIVAFLFFYAGVVWVTSGGSPSKLIHGKKILSSAIIGFILVCTAWLIVQTIVVGLATNTTIFTGGNWSTLNCVDDNPATGTRPRSNSLTDLLNFSTNPGTVAPGGPGTTPGLCNNSQCSIGDLQAVGYTAKQAAVMSCIAIAESGGQASRVNPNGGACGLFQVLPSNWAKPQLHTGSCSAQTSCTDATCNAQTAFILSQGRLNAGQSPYADWTCPRCDPNGTKAACVNQYGV